METGLVVAALLLPCLAITALKGKWKYAVLAALVVLFAVLLPITAIRLAKPESWWARRFYDDEKIRRSQARYAGGGQFIKRQEPDAAAQTNDG